MKKVVLLVLSLVLATACVIVSFADYWGNLVDFEKALTLVGRSFNDGGIGNAVHRPAFVQNNEIVDLRLVVFLVCFHDVDVLI